MVLISLLQVALSYLSLERATRSLHPSLRFLVACRLVTPKWKTQVEFLFRSKAVRCLSRKRHTSLHDLHPRKAQNKTTIDESFDGFSQQSLSIFELLLVFFRVLVAEAKVHSSKDPHRVRPGKKLKCTTTTFFFRIRFVFEVPCGWTESAGLVQGQFLNHETALFSPKSSPVDGLLFTLWKTKLATKRATDL